MDTNVINDVLYDKHKEEVINRIIALYEPVFSIYTIYELIATPDRQQRHELLITAEKLRNNIVPLASPSDILKRTLEAYSQSQLSVNCSILGKDLGVMSLLKSPDKADDAASNMARDWTQGLQIAFDDLHNSARPNIQQIISGMTADERNLLQYSRDAFLEFLFTKSTFFNDLIEGFIRTNDLPGNLLGKETEILTSLDI